jgi:hypothetical protein
MTNIQRVIGFLHLDFRAQAVEEVERRNRIAGIETAGKFSRGNIPIQDGMVTTERDLQQEREDLKGARFI